MTCSKCARSVAESLGSAAGTHAAGGDARMRCHVCGAFLGEDGVCNSPRHASLEAAAEGVLSKLRDAGWLYQGVSVTDKAAVAMVSQAVQEAGGGEAAYWRGLCQRLVDGIAELDGSDLLPRLEAPEEREGDAENPLDFLDDPWDEAVAALGIERNGDGGDDSGDMSFEATDARLRGAGYARTTVVAGSPSEEYYEPSVYAIYHTPGVDVAVAIRDATRAFVATEKGQAYREEINETPFNWGDAVTALPAEILAKHGIAEILDQRTSTEGDTLVVDYDERLD